MRKLDFPSVFFLRLVLVSLGLALAGCQTARHPAWGSFTFQSPDRRIAFHLSAHGPLRYTVAFEGTNIIANAALGLRFHDGSEIGEDAQLLGQSYRFIDKTWTNLFGKRSLVRNQCNEYRFHFREVEKPRRRFTLVVRAYDDGVAFRYELPRQWGFHKFVVDEEESSFAFPADAACFAGQNKDGGFHGPEEWNFERRSIAILTNGVYGLPLLVHTPAAWVAITESDLRDWSGMWLACNAGTTTLRAHLAPRLDHDGLVKAEAPHASPWRVLMIGETPGRLAESDLIMNLAAPNQLGDVSWVKPGMMAWDHWWSGDTKMDTATLEQYIQLAADMHWPYQMIDWHWYGEPAVKTADITRVDPAVDMPAVLQFARERGVREWAWLNWQDVDRNDAYKKAFPLYEKWGLAGVKIDFMDRDDQDMVNWYEKITRAAAAHHLMVDFHGAFKPTGLNRTLPNQITREGVLGNEWNKWSRQDTPEHKLTLPFTRFLAGPADYTPGGFLNRQPEAFQIVSTNTEVQGTRAMELALFVVFDSPICCACDSPAHYRGQPGVDLLQTVPTVWDETRYLDSAVGEHLAVARRHGNEWWLAAMNAGPALDLELKLDFLSPGPWKGRLWHDGPNAATNAEDLATDNAEVTAPNSLGLHLAPNGGAVAHFWR